MKKDSEELTKEIFALMWYMRGGISRQEAWELSPHERRILNEWIKERIEFVEKSGMPIL